MPPPHGLLMSPLPLQQTILGCIADKHKEGRAGTIAQTRILLESLHSQAKIVRYRKLFSLLAGYIEVRNFLLPKMSMQ